MSSIANQIGAEIEGNTAPIGIYTKIDEEKIIFGNSYRGWGQFVYNGNRDRALQPINEGELKLSVDDSNVPNPVPDNIDPTDPSAFSPAFDPSKANFILMVLDMKNQRWIGQDNFTYLGADCISSSRLGEDDVRGGYSITPPESGCFQAPQKITEIKSENYSVGIGSWSTTNTKSVLDAIDFNGDGYPDIAFEDNIQYTNARGGLEEISLLHEKKSHLSLSKAISIPLGGKTVSARSNNTVVSQPALSSASQTTSNNEVNSISSESAQESSKVSIGLSGNILCNSDIATETWMDVNGDGLPDKVYDGDNVALNLGYKFAPVEKWGITVINKGSIRDKGAGLGISLKNGSISAGVGVTLSQSGSLQTLQDVNGDGLVDMIRLECDKDIPDLVDAELSLQEAINDLTTCLDSALDRDALTCKTYVRFNTGNGFVSEDEEIEWTGYEAIEESSSVGQSANAAFTVCVPMYRPKKSCHLGHAV